VFQRRRRHRTPQEDPVMTARPIRRTTASRSPLAAFAAVAVAGALLLTGCGDQTDDASGGGEGGEKKSEAPLFSELPKKIQDKGKLVVGSDIAYAPVEFKDDKGETVGIDPDIARALGKQLGVDVEFQNGTFDQLILGMNTGRYDIVMSAVTDTKERQRGASEDSEGGADFVNYFKAGSALLVAKDTDDITTPDDLCGKTVAAQRGTANEALIKEQQKSCDKKIDPFIADQDTDSITQLQSGRADAVITDFPVAAYNARTVGGGDSFKVVGDQIDAAPYGIAVSKKNTELRDAVRAALEAIMENGEYAKVLKKWDVSNGALTEVTVNAGK
jgi:polar amino acid transport system substrate-binding protein